jgi:hypothetical protein
LRQIDRFLDLSPCGGPLKSQKYRIKKAGSKRRRASKREISKEPRAPQKTQSENREKSRGCGPEEPCIKTEDSTQQSNLSNPESRVMRKNLRSGYIQSSNARAGVDTEGSNGSWAIESVAPPPTRGNAR